jgi:hypothetical protein
MQAETGIGESKGVPGAQGQRRKVDGRDSLIEVNSYNLIFKTPHQDKFVLENVERAMLVAVTTIQLVRAER